MNWSWKFQQDIEKFGVLFIEIDKIWNVWNQFYDFFKICGLDVKGMLVEIVVFESVMKQCLVLFNKIVFDYQKEVIQWMKIYLNMLQIIMKLVFVVMGGYIGVYMVGVGVIFVIIVVFNE